MDLFFILNIAILIFSIVIHEVAHGYAAYLQGDMTAKAAGRLTLNPLKHLDPWGSVLIPFVLAITHAGVMFGWAKPVPYNPYNLRNSKYGPALVGAAGPLSNLLLALVSGVLIRTLILLGVENFWLNFLTSVAFINIVLMVFNLLPIPPLDGSKLLFAVLPISEQTKATLEQFGFVILIFSLYTFKDLINFIILFAFRLFEKNIVGVSLADFM